MKYYLPSIGLSFVTALLIFTANHTNRDYDLLDTIIDYVHASAENKRADTETIRSINRG